MARDGGFCILSRCGWYPVVPFFIIVLAMGLTSIRTATFYWVSQSWACWPASLV